MSDSDVLAPSSWRRFQSRFTALPEEIQLLILQHYFSQAEPLTYHNRLETQVLVNQLERVLPAAVRLVPEAIFTANKVRIAVGYPTGNTLFPNPDINHFVRDISVQLHTMSSLDFLKLLASGTIGFQNLRRLNIYTITSDPRGLIQELSQMGGLQFRAKETRVILNWHECDNGCSEPGDKRTTCLFNQELESLVTVTQGDLRVELANDVYWNVQDERDNLGYWTAEIFST